VNATVIATLISFIIPGCQFDSSLTNPERKGQPPYQKTTAERPKSR
jgi:hypothetical protein